MRNILGFLLLACTCLIAGQCHAAFYSMFISVEQNNATSGEATYSFQFLLQDFGSTADLVLSSPGGSRYEGIPNLGSVFADEEGLSLDQLSNAFLGDWNFEETLNGFTKSYQISLPQVPQELLTTPVPVITSPSHGQTVGKVFDLTWTNPDPGGLGVNYSSFDDVPSFRQVLHRNGPGDYTFDFTAVSDFTPIHFLRFSIVKTLSPLDVVVTPISTNADASFLGRNIDFEVHSPSVSFTVIPEPASVLLLGMTVVCATGGRGFVIRPERR